MALGLVLTFWPGMSGTVFCWGIAAALILYAAHSFWYFIILRTQKDFVVCGRRFRACPKNPQTFSKKV